ncbi:ATP-binding cassette domain-containing protein [Sporosarcina sp. ACRSL]|uniref:ABC transporter ATP-binding protein n=1 Tax=Sporosarcina sp. ACRSL TaxID=2918215 RepID=UPI001EF5BE7C|nr:oligopeptide/dipeptide ABC transporter ATP-binding protein [Sporosarcina sp. ACRSL]MCG7344005.1 ATP-binding cassette domain-containing protein [Sporosarcina sp. ACRSL]
MKSSILTMENIKCHFPIERGIFKTKQSVKALDGVDLNIYEGDTFGLVGESGSGKSTLARVVAGLQRPTNGRVFFRGKDITPLRNQESKALKISDIQMVFQDPYSSIDPRMLIGEIIEEPMLIAGWGKSERKKRTEELLELVGLSKEAAKRYPHEMSGGQRQRVAIARAIALKPKLVICDESVSALDVSIQAQILNLLDDLQTEFNLTYLFIAHDLGVVRHMSDVIGIMYLGEIVEKGMTEEVYQNPLHPYTKALVSMIPTIEHRIHNRERIVLKGEIPSPMKLPKGCRFHTRCPYKMKICEDINPKLQEVEEGRLVSCHLFN